MSEDQTTPEQRSSTRMRSIIWLLVIFGILIGGFWYVMQVALPVSVNMGCDRPPEMADAEKVLNGAAIATDALGTPITIGDPEVCVTMKDQPGQPKGFTATAQGPKGTAQVVVVIGPSGLLGVIYTDANHHQTTLRP